MKIGRPMVRLVTVRTRATCEFLGRGKGNKGYVEGFCSSADKKQREPRNTLCTVRRQHGDIRIDFVEGSNPMGLKNGDMLVSGDAGHIPDGRPERRSGTLSATTPATGGSPTGTFNPALRSGGHDEDDGPNQCDRHGFVTDCYSPGRSFVISQTNDLSLYQNL